MKRALGDAADAVVALVAVARGLDAAQADGKPGIFGREGVALVFMAARKKRRDQARHDPDDARADADQ